MQPKVARTLRQSRRAVGLPLVRARRRVARLVGSWDSGPPDFVGVGAQRAGTSWWHRAIDHHPDVHDRGPFGKELHYFDRFWTGDFAAAEIEGYHRRFDRPAGKRCGEWTPRYMFDPWTPPLLHRAAPEARLLVLLRDPVSRLVSAVTHATERGRKVDESVVSIAIARGYYHRQLTHLLRHFPREQVLVLQLEKCTAQPAAELARTLRFLGLRDDVDLSAALATQVNTRKGSPLTVRPELLSEVTATLEGDVRALVADFPEVDVRLWPNFAGAR